MENICAQEAFVYCKLTKAVGYWGADANERCFAARRAPNLLISLNGAPTGGAEGRKAAARRGLPASALGTRLLHLAYISR